jgi:hypothetical protein
LAFDGITKGALKDDRNASNRPRLNKLFSEHLDVRTTLQKIESGDSVMKLTRKETTSSSLLTTVSAPIACTNVAMAACWRVW